MQHYQEVTIQLDKTLSNAIWYGTIVPVINCSEHIKILIELKPDTKAPHRFLPGIPTNKPNVFLAPFGDGSFMFEVKEN